MNAAFEELDYRATPLGELTLWRRHALSVPGAVVYEVRLAGEFLMSSLVNDSERALATRVLPRLGQRPCDVLIGGLGLGHTAQTALQFPQVRSVVVVEKLPEIIDWHRRELVPLGRELSTDPRCELRCADFFALVGGAPERRFDAVLLDIDHSPRDLLDAGHGSFYTAGGLRRLKEHLKPDGIFALWSADPAGDSFLSALKDVFDDVETHAIDFYNPHIGQRDTNFIYAASVT